MSSLKHKLKLVRRGTRFFFQRLFYGFDESDTWSLDHTLAKWLLPRLKLFREVTIAYPCHPETLKTMEDWRAILDKMIKAFEIIADKDKYWDFDSKEKEEEKQKVIKEGLDLFRLHFQDLWW